MASLPEHRLPLTDLLDVLPDAAVVIDRQGVIRHANPAVRPLLGHAPEDLVGQPLAVMVPPELRERHARMVQTYQQRGAPTQMGARPVLQALHREGRPVAVSISLCNLELPELGPVSVAILHDLGELHSHLRQAHDIAETDALSGLGNRLRLSRELTLLLQRGAPFGLLYLDLERFKALNDEQGHAAGDRAIQILAQRLLTHVRPGDLVVRLGGDEFVLVLQGLADAQHLQQRALRAAELVLEPFRLDDRACSLGVNIGGCLHPQHGRSETALLQAADRAMYTAKKSGQTYAHASVD